MPEGYDTYIEQGGTNVSGGQKQRLCIARAILRRPKVLILDDSTSAVDTATDAAIRQGLRSTLPGTTKVIIAQRISSVQDADINVFALEKLHQPGTYENPCVLAQGMDYVLVDGAVAVEKGKYTGVKAGRILKRA